MGDDDTFCHKEVFETKELLYELMLIEIAGISDGSWDGVCYWQRNGSLNSLGSCSVM